MCEVMDRQDEGWLEVGDIKKFPCQDLKNINRLWVRYGNGKFGFSVQKKIWQECGSPTNYNEDWKNYGDRVGWRVKGSWINFKDVKNSTSAPLGHLPVSVCCGLNMENAWISSRRFLPFQPTSSLLARDDL